MRWNHCLCWYRVLVMMLMLGAGIAPAAQAAPAGFSAWVEAQGPNHRATLTLTATAWRAAGGAASGVNP